jgi:peptide subunit release factor 1 (eRF1)
MAETTALATVIGELAKIRPGPYRVVSCYLRLETTDRVRRKYLVELQGAMTRAEASIAALDGDLRRPIERDLRRIVAAVETPVRLPAAPGIAIFACEARKLFQVVPMPRVHHTRVLIDRVPRISELLATEEETGRLLVAVIDRARARFFEVGAFDVHEVADLWADSTRGGKFKGDRRDSPGSGESSFQHRIEEERHRHFAGVARQLALLDREHPAAGIILAGPAEQTKSAAKFLPHSLADRFMGMVRLNPTAVSAAEVRVRALQVHREFERGRERALCSEMEGKVGEGWATNGPQPTLRALARGQVRTLLIRADLTGWGFRCADTGRLVLSKAECRGEGEPQPVADLVNEAIEEALAQRVGVAVFHGPEAAESIDGLAALLRFR